MVLDQHLLFFREAIDDQVTYRQTDSMKGTIVNFEQGITILLLDAYEGGVVALSVGAGSGLSDFQPP